MSARRNTIDLMVAGGPEIGFGHVMRSGAIAAEAIRRGITVRAYLHGNTRAAQKLSEASGCHEILGWEAWPDEAPGDLLLLDLPDDKTSWLDLAEQRTIPAVILDDARALGRARLTICPSLHEHPVESPHFVAGPRYTVLSRSHLETPRRALESRHELLLSLGGSDPHRATVRVAPLIARLLDDESLEHAIHSRHVVLGPGFLDPEGRDREALLDGGWQVHHALPIEAMAHRMAASRLAVIGFGTSLGELAWLETPHLSISHHERDDVHARRLEARGIGMHLGFGPDLDLLRVEEKLRAALTSDDWQLRSAERALASLEDARGAARIVQHLLDIMDSNSIGRLSRATQKGAHVSPS